MSDFAEVTNVTKKLVTEHLAPMEAAFKQSKAGIDILERFGSYRQKASQYESEAVQALEKAKGNPVVFGGKTIATPHEAASAARDMSRAQHFGKKDEGLVYLLNAAKKEKGDVHAQVLSDHLGVAFKDSVAKAGPTAGKNKLTQNVLTANARMAKAQDDLNLFFPEVKSWKQYQPIGKVEQNVRAYTAATLAAHAAIPHSISSLNTVMAEGLGNYIKAVTKAIPLSTYDDTVQFLKGTNALGELSGMEMRQHYSYEQSLIKKGVDKVGFVPDSIGEFVHRNFSMPGMPAVRKWNLTVAAMASKFSIEELSAHLMQGGEVGDDAALKLHRFKLDPDAIRAQGGTLTKDQWATGLFHGTDYSAFIENPMKRASIATSTTWGRMIFAFHGFTSRQAKFIADDLKYKYSTRDVVGMARTLAVLGLIAPEAAAGMHFISDLINGQGIDKSEKNYSELEGKMHGANGFRSMLFGHIEAMSHFAAFGITSSYLRQVARKKLANAFVGPAVNAFVVEPLEDAYSFLLSDSAHPGQRNAAERDLLHDVPTMGLGGLASHALFPTKDQLNAHKVKSARAEKAAATRKAHKKPSNNPIRRFFETPGE